MIRKDKGKFTRSIAYVEVELGGKHGLMQTYSEDFTKNRLIQSIKQSEEVGDFTKTEQWQFSNIMKTVKNIGGFNKLSYEGLKELEHIVKVLSSNGDKSEMAKDEVNDFISDISKKEHKYIDKWGRGD